MKTETAVPEQSVLAERAASIQSMFQRIAPRYDLMNRLMTGGLDITWRKQVIGLSGIQPGGMLLDLGAGTGDLTREALRQSPGCSPISADFTLAMLQAGQRRPGLPLRWTCADALHLPFPSQTYDAVVSGFLLRNVVDLPGALFEMYRVLKPGGRLVALDTTQPRPSLFSPLIRFHMHQVIPFLGGLLAGSKDAYSYLPDSSEQFLRAEDLLQALAAAGFQSNGFQLLMFGTVAIHWGSKPDFHNKANP